MKLESCIIPSHSEISAILRVNLMSLKNIFFKKVRMVLRREGFVPECCVAKRGYQLECDKTLHREFGGVKITIFR